jgi:hypothetical protein
MDGDSTRVAVSRSIQLCRRCKKDVLPQRAVGSLRLDMHRAPAKGMAAKADPKAERIKARKDRKHRSLRAEVKAHGIANTVRLVLSGELAALAPRAHGSSDDECPECQRLQRSA